MTDLNSKMYSSGSFDRWWYNISNPNELVIDTNLVFNLWDSDNKHIIKKVEIVINRLWLNRIHNASTHYYKEREICKVHILREHSSNEYKLYFGKIKEGVYPIL